MILPNVRASFGRAEVGAIMTAIAGSDSRARDALSDRLTHEGLDALLD
ncbi:MAG: hypothetical protein GWM90_14130, partial [Gemmatimonadetes bacterium]|nr:hypothetical protein [Gemmatimonadota bacterium]NIQ55278.1 hypothetical protein [Gemmatimonadota bacterium]NIU75479.1 hypothetical protein [Gammaproteobacteria bacterium]NIX45206.1 hypothetical protein [Gemmatimonadota bacterium]NIY09462.1 hypothetical protein [Gemmatimonadota bacterium]